MTAILDLARRGVLALLLLVSATAVVAAPLALTIDDTSGLPRLLKGGPAMDTSYVFWGPNWSWGRPEIKPRRSGPFERELGGRVADLGLTVEGDVKRAGERSLVWRWTIDAAAARQGVIGGGLAFQFDLGAFGDEMGEPELLPDNRGWAWGRPGGERVELRFEPALAAVFFDRGGKSQIRAFFHKDEIAAGRRAHTATLSVSGGARLQLPDSERHGLPGAAQWPASALDANTSPVDLSFLNDGNKPAGKRGFVRAVGDRLEFADGTPARFWGVNLSAYALFRTRDEQVRAQARRLARLGFNLVRLHHHDSG